MFANLVFDIYTASCKVNQQGSIKCQPFRTYMQYIEAQKG